jgi:hypothetical protein
MYYVVTHLVSSTFSCWIWKINNFSMGFNSRVCIWNDIHAINSQIPFPWRWTLKQQPQLLFNAISFQRQTGLLYRYRWRLPVWNVKNRRYLASCTLQFGSNLTKIIFQSKHFNYFIVMGGWRHVFWSDTHYSISLRYTPNIVQLNSFYIKFDSKHFFYHSWVIVLFGHSWHIFDNETRQLVIV